MNAPIPDGWTLEKSDIPTTLIWGELDAIAPVAVPDLSGRAILRTERPPPPIGASRARITIYRLTNLD